MSGKPVVLREQARRDIDEAVEHNLAEAGEAVALDFIDALEDTRRRIGEQPASGSPRYAHELDIPGLRYLTVGKFPHLVFYVEGDLPLSRLSITRTHRSSDERKCRLGSPISTASRSGISLPLRIIRS